MAALSLRRFAAHASWRLRRWLHRPAAGPLLVLLASGLALAAALWFWHAGQRLEAARDRQRSQLAAASPPSRPAVVRQGMLTQFIDGLPTFADLPAAVQSLLDQADRQGLRLLRGSYRLQPEPGARFARYRMNLPVRGDPEQVQRFIGAALLADPSLAVESIQFRREDDSGRVLEARIQWVLFVRMDAPASTRPTSTPGSALRGGRS